MSQYLLWLLGWKLGADSIFVYVAAGPLAKAEPIAALLFFSSTSVLKLCAAWAMLGALCEALMGVTAPPVRTGVETPLLFWVAITEASLRVASAMICLTFLLRR